MREIVVIFVLVMFATLLLVGGCWAVPQYHVYTKTMDGKALLHEAEYTRQIAVLDAQAEVERARGVAQANEIIGESLHNNEGYLRYLWINGLQTNRMQVVYVPTEAGLPILEANRFPIE